MLERARILELQELSEGFTLLYVEDNDGLREKALTLFKKLFVDVISASDGQEGYEIFKKHRPQIVITDIQMPKLNGLEMMTKIKSLEPSTKIIITSAFDNKEYLFKAIEGGVFSYLKKPLNIEELVKTLVRCINTINLEENSSMFITYMDDLINYQSDILALMSKKIPIFVNQMFLDFFDLEIIENFESQYVNFGQLLLPHNGFLYNHDEIDWFTEAIKDEGKIFHVKIKDKKGDNRHFILKMHSLPNKKNMYILSLNDITALNLLSLFDNRAFENDKQIKSRSTIVNLMKILHKNSAEIKIYNYYKGLTITNIGLVVDIQNQQLKVKTSFMQQKAAQYQKSILITSDIFPSAILCKPIQNIDFELQTISFENMRFVSRNPTQRKYVRVFPEEHHTVSLFHDNRKVYADTHIYDISVDAIKLEIDAIPAGLKKGTSVSLDMVLDHDNKNIIIHTPAEVLRVEEKSKTFFIVLKQELTSEYKKVLIDYVARRQMVLIREFKGLQFG